MSRLAKWKVEKTKVKVVFRLQFHATHIPQTGWDKLFISFTPAESGKATAKTTKAIVKNGTCKWGDPIYESTRLLQDAKTKCFDEKLYKFVVSMGTSRSSILGDTTINLADYADAIKPFGIALPLRGSDSGTILHVTVQLLTSKTGFREFEQQGELREKGFQATTDQNCRDESSSGKVASTEIAVTNQHNKVNAGVKFKPESREHHLQEDLNLNEEYADSAIGCDGASNTSESINAEKHDTSSTHEMESLKSTMSGDVGVHSLSQSPQAGPRVMTRENKDWVHGWGSDYSIDNDLAIAYEENSKLRGCLEVAESSINRLKLEVSTLQSQVYEISSETQKFTHQLADEIASGEEMGKTISVLKSECLELKCDLERLLRMASERETVKDIREIKVHQNTKNVNFSGGGFDLDMYQPEDMLHSLCLPGLISHEPDSVDATHVIRGKFFELLRELDESKAERESLTKKMDQMELYYEALIHELEENQKRMLIEVQNLRQEQSTSLYAVTSTKTQMEIMRQEMENQIIKSDEDKRMLGALNMELEKRAVTSEASLKRARLNYSIAVDRLQKDLELLSVQVVSMFETNENLIKESFPKATSYPSHQKQKQFIGGDMILDDLGRSLYLQEELYKKVEEELCDMHVENINLDVFSRALQETLHEARSDSRRMADKIVTVTLQLESSTKSNELLLQRLQNAMEDIQTLERKLQSLSGENRLHRIRITECEAVMIELGNHKSEYEACATEKIKLESSLKQEVKENESLRYEISSLHETLRTVKSDNDEMASSKENLKTIMNFLEHKLGNMLLTLNKEFNEDDLELNDLTTTVLQMEEFQNKVCCRIHQLLETTKNLQEERDIAVVSSTTAKEEIIAVKQKFEHDLKTMVNKLDMTNIFVQKLQLNLENLADRLEFSSETEEKIVQLKEELVSDFSSLEVELQEVISKNKYIAQEILALGIVTEESSQKNQDLMKSLQEKDYESVHLASELNSVRECLQYQRDKLIVEKGFRDKLEGTVTELTFEFNKKNDHFDLQKAELVHVKEMVSQLELEASRLNQLVMESDEYLKKTHKEFSLAEAELLKMHELFLAADVSFIYAVTHYKSRIEQLFEQLQSTNREVEDLHKKHADVAHCIDENKNLEMTRESLKSELESAVAQYSVLLNSNSQIRTELEHYKNMAEIEKKNYLEDQNQHALEVQKQKHAFASSEQQIDCLMLSNIELGIKGVLLKVNVEELTQKLSEQVIKTEELTELSNHMKELKEKAESEFQQIRERRESQESLRMIFIKEQYETKIQEFKHQLSVSKKHGEEMLWKLQDTIDEVENIKKSEASNLKKNEELSMRTLDLESDIQKLISEKREKTNACDRIQAELECALISLECCKEEKEKLEASLEECKDAKEKLEASLQACNDGNEKLKASLLLRNDEKEKLESSLQVCNDKNEKLKAFFQESNNEKEKLEAFLQECNEEKGKLESSLQVYNDEKEKLKASLQACNDEKEKLESSLQVYNDEKEKLKVFLQACNDEKEKLESSLQECNDEKGKILVELAAMKDQLGNSIVPVNGIAKNTLEHDSKVNCEEAENACLALIDAEEISNALVNVEPIQDIHVSRGVHGISGHQLVDQLNSLHNESKNLALINDHFKTQSLKSSMDRLHNELEKMKNENSLLPRDIQNIDPNFQDLQRELMQLHQANEELGSIFPSYNELSTNGNAVERVLALEVELAESLQSKKKSSTPFQSSFLKQHGDEEAVFKSFRDINELIKDMLEIKGRYANVKTELKEMQDRYSQLSLQFAEVEGERQKLMMTLKNVRASKKHLLLNRSSSANLADNLS